MGCKRLRKVVLVKPLSGRFYSLINTDSKGDIMVKVDCGTIQNMKKGKLCV